MEQTDEEKCEFAERNCFRHTGHVEDVACCGDCVSKGYVCQGLCLCNNIVVIERVLKAV